MASSPFPEYLWIILCVIPRYVTNANERWKIPWTKEPAGLQSIGSQRVGHDWPTSLFTSLQLPYLGVLTPSSLPSPTTKHRAFLPSQHLLKTSISFPLSHHLNLNRHDLTGLQEWSPFLQSWSFQIHHPCCSWDVSTDKIQTWSRRFICFSVLSTVSVL